ncbi:MAG: aspartate aminotransferase family protein [Acidimicrobiales bacterium]
MTPALTSGSTATGSLMGTYAPAPVTFVSGAGTELFDARGKRYLDFLSGLAVTSLGHARPEVTAAVEQQAAKLVHVSNLFGNEVGPEVAATIDLLVGDGEPAGGRVFFCNSGAEANECAIKLARRAQPGRPGVVAALGSFHGRTLACLAATGQPAKWEGFGPMPEGFAHVEFGNVAAMREAATATVGTVLLETTQGEGGVVPSPPGYLEEVRELCDSRGLLLVLDEVQTGLGRTGRWFAFQHAGVQPDVVTIAKALGNGVPVGACWANDGVAAAFQVGDHGSTFGGQPLAMAAARATLGVMREIDAPRMARTKGARLIAALGALKGVTEVRGTGLLLGAVLDSGLDSRAVVAAALEAGLVINSPVAGVLRLAPPLTVSAAELDEGIAILAGVLAAARERVG